MCIRDRARAALADLPADRLRFVLGEHPLSLLDACDVLALMTNQWLIFPIIIAIPVATELSTTLQVLYFRATGGKRLFKMAPLHHHFELIGWSETQIVQRWWLIAMLTAMIGIALALV